MSQAQSGNRMAARVAAFSIGCAILAVWFFVSVANPSPPTRGLHGWWLSRVVPEAVSPLHVEDTDDWFVAAYRRESSLVVSAWKHPRDGGWTPPYKFSINGHQDGSEVDVIDPSGELSFDHVHVDWLSGRTMFGQTFVAPILPGFSGDLEVGISVAKPIPQDEHAGPPVRLREEPEKTFLVAFG